MKTVQTFTTCLLLFIGITTTAQEKQNDATWEETVEFLAENIDKFNLTLVHKNIKQGKSPFSYTIQQEYSLNGKIVLKGTNLYQEASIEQIKAANIKKSEEGCISLKLTFTKNSVKCFYDNDENHTYFEDNFFIAFETRSTHNVEDGVTTCHSNKWSSEDEFVQRMLKAFKHLAYLANEKRSQSKF